MSAAWTRKAGQNPRGGLNAKGRASYKAETGGTLRPPVKAGDNPRRASFLARMGAMPGPERDGQGRPTRLLLSLQWRVVVAGTAARQLLPKVEQVEQQPPPLRRLVAAGRAKRVRRRAS